MRRPAFVWGPRSNRSNSVRGRVDVRGQRLVRHRRLLSFSLGRSGLRPPLVRGARAAPRNAPRAGLTGGGGAVLGRLDIWSPRLKPGANKPISLLRRLVDVV